jgi:hypothetical protein
MGYKAGKRTRAIAHPANDVASRRYDLYSAAWKRIRRCIDDEYFLESIALIESLMCDRLESRLTFLRGIDFSFKTLGQLINEATRIETDAELLNYITSDLDAWRSARNKAAHEMVKIETNEAVSWESRLATNKSVALEGMRVLRLVGGRVNFLQDASPVGQNRRFFQ